MGGKQMFLVGFWTRVKSVVSCLLYKATLKEESILEARETETASDVEWTLLYLVGWLVADNLLKVDPERRKHWCRLTDGLKSNRYDMCEYWKLDSVVFVLIPDGYSISPSAGRNTFSPCKTRPSSIVLDLLFQLFSRQNASFLLVDIVLLPFSSLEKDQCTSGRLRHLAIGRPKYIFYGREKDSSHQSE